MKKTLLIVAIAGLAMASCKKDLTCECTVTTTDIGGTTTTSPVITTSMKEISKSDAKSECQKSTTVDVNPDGKTETTVSDCKLK